jgi:integrase
MELKWHDYFGDYAVFRQTKNGDERVVPIPIFIKRLIDKLPHDSELVFNATHLSTINHDLKLRCKNLGIVKDEIHCHIFRHSFITQLIKSNAPLPSIAKLVGHKDLSSTQIYSHMLIDDMRLAQAMHPLCREEATIESISKKIREFVDSLVDKNKYVIQVTEGVDFQLKVVHRL